MTDAGLVKQISELFHETGEEHHKAFIETEGVDPEWPLWYADYLLDKLHKILGASFTKAELVYLLVTADKEQVLRAPGADWTKYYAKLLIDRYV